MTRQTFVLALIFISDPVSATHSPYMN